MAPSAVVDLRRPVETGPLIAELKAQRWDRLFAVTPLAAWTLEDAGLKFETNAALVERSAFRSASLKNFERIQRAMITAFGSEHESWMGLMLELTACAAYALAEDMRLRSLQGLDLHVFSDVPYDARNDAALANHLYNRSALYFRILPEGRHHLVERRSECLGRLLNRLKRLTPAGFARKLLDLMPTRRRPGPALVTDYGYDWAALRPSLKPRFVSWTFAQLARAALSLGGPQPDPAALDRFCDALEEEFRTLLPNTLAPFLSLARGRAARYALLRRRCAEHMPTLIKRHDLRAALGTLCGTDEQFLAHYYLKAAGKPSVFYQHGAYMQLWPMTGPAEVVPATHNLVYGCADAAFLSSLRPDQRVYRVGSALLDALTPDQPRKGAFLYVLFHNPGNLMLAESEFAYPETDHAWLFARHRRVLELFSRFRGLSLTIRPHPAHFTWCLYEPLREFIQRRAITNVHFDQSTFDPDRYYSGYEGVIMDYPSTGLLQALAKGKNIACHIGKPYRVAADGEAELRRAVSCADDDDAFLAIIARWFSHGADDGDPQARRQYLERFGKADRPSLSLVLPLLDTLLT